MSKVSLQKVKRFMLSGWDLVRDPRWIATGGEYDRMEYYREYLGAYGINWILCYKNNVLVAQYNAQFVESIEFEDEPAKELADDRGRGR